MWWWDRIGIGAMNELGSNAFGATNASAQSYGGGEAYAVRADRDDVVRDAISAMLRAHVKGQLAASHQQPEDNSVTDVMDVHVLPSWTSLQPRDTAVALVRMRLLQPSKSKSVVAVSGTYDTVYDATEMLSNDVPADVRTTDKWLELQNCVVAAPAPTWCSIDEMIRHVQRCTTHTPSIVCRGLQAPFAHVAAVGYSIEVENMRHAIVVLIDTAQEASGACMPCGVAYMNMDSVPLYSLL